MPLPAIIVNHLSPLGALAPSGPPPGPPPGGAGTMPGGPPQPTAKSLAFVMHPQEQVNWCWSAVAVSVAQFYNAVSIWTSQCRLAAQELGLVCCPAGSVSACDVPWYLDRALARTNNYSTYAAGAAPFADVRGEIDVDHPLCVRIGWTGGGGHFVVISGYATMAGVQFVTIEDPINSQSTLAYQTFLNQYQGSGTWTHSFWTRP